MAKLKAADFYYGAVLSLLFNNHIKPALIEGGESRQIYDFTTNNTEFRLFTKYRADKNATKKENYNSWTFTFTDSDKDEIAQYINENHNLIIGMVCGSKNLSQSEIIFIDKDEILRLLETKSSLNISRMKGEHAFRISTGGGRAKAYQVKANRFEELFLSNK